MSHINYDFKFSAEAAPYLDDFTLGFLFASHTDLDLYEDFAERESTNEDLSYLSVALMRKDCLEIQLKSSLMLDQAQKHGVSINQIGYDYWHIRNNKPYYYLQALPIDLRESLITIFQIYGKPCSMIQNKEGNYIFTYQDRELQKIKEDELMNLYYNLSSKKNDNSEVPKFSYKNPIKKDH